MGDTTKCTCGRPKWTPPDLQRWEDEARECPIPTKFNPDWAKSICWYVGPDKCPMKPVAS